MRSLKLLTLLSGVFLGLSGCASAPPAAHVATASAPAVAHYSTADTSIGALMDDPAARAVVDKYLPHFSEGDRLNMVRGTTLRAIQGYGPSVLTDERLGHIDAELALLTPIAPPAGAPAIRVVNVNEDRVAPYVLPDALKLANGEPVRDAATWWNKRRPEILNSYESLVYGRAPGRPEGESFNVFDRGTSAFGGTALRKQVLIHLSTAPNAPTIQLVEYIPAHARGPVPMFLMIHFTPPSSAFDDPGIREGMVWDPATHRRVPASQAPGMGHIDIAKFLAAGIGVASYYYGDVDPDFQGGYAMGVRALYQPNEADRAPDAWGAIAAWAWSLSRVQDYLETDPSVDAHRVAIYGASRLGKTVLWAGARDQRFAAVIACCSGKLGGAIMRRNYGEPINGTNGGDSAYWVARNLTQFYNHEDTLPVDSHELLALIAPRPVLLQTGSVDHAADPHGEFLAEVAASPVYELLGGQGLGTTTWPPRAPILNDLGYVMHDGGHGPVPSDWDVYAAFLQRHLHPQN